MSRRKKFWLSVIALLLVVGIAGWLIGWLPSPVSQTAEPATASDTIILRNKNNNNGEIRGKVVKKDAAGRFVTIKDANNSQLSIPWDDIESVTNSEQAWSEKSIDELIELTSKLGVIAGVLGILVFILGIWQYRKDQKWKRAQFLAHAADEFNAHQLSYNAKLMLDSMLLYREGRRIKLYPDEQRTKDKYKDVKNREIYEALAIGEDKKNLKGRKGVKEKRKAIADCFDALLHRLERFNHYIESGLAKKEEVKVHIIYWIDLIGDAKSESKKLYHTDFRHRLWNYIINYNFTGVQKLLEIYGYPITEKPDLRQRLWNYIIRHIERLLKRCGYSIEKAPEEPIKQDTKKPYFRQRLCKYVIPYTKRLLEIRGYTIKQDSEEPVKKETEKPEHDQPPVQ